MMHQYRPQTLNAASLVMTRHPDLDTRRFQDRNSSCVCSLFGNCPARQNRSRLHRAHSLLKTFKSKWSPRKFEYVSHASHVMFLNSIVVSEWSDFDSFLNCFSSSDSGDSVPAFADWLRSRWPVSAGRAHSRQDAASSRRAHVTGWPFKSTASLCIFHTSLRVFRDDCMSCCDGIYVSVYLVGDSEYLLVWRQPNVSGFG
jgi:hypothetical protein